MNRKIRRAAIKFFRSSKKIKRFIRNLDLGSFEFKMEVGALKRNHYAYICYNAAKLAKKMGYKKISIIEYGVGEGSGLMSLEKYADEIQKIFGIDLEIYGFDSGKGLPKPVDYRDLPYHWKEGFFSMNEKDLQQKLKKTKLILGDIKETSKTFFS